MTLRLLFSIFLAVGICHLSSPLIAGDDSHSQLLLQKNPVDLGDGRSLNIVCTGRGNPTIVVENGLGSNLLHWQKLVGPLSKIARTCFYDRAGYGYSDPANRPSTAMNVTDDLHDLLRRAGVKRPIILVGHSLGGLFATLYADRFPRDVAGLVLLDPSFAHQDASESIQELAADAVAFDKGQIQLQACALLAEQNRLITETHRECFEFAPNRTPAEKAYLLHQFSRPFRYKSVISEAASFHSSNGSSDENSLAEERARRPFGDMPLIVMTAGDNPIQPGQSEEQRQRAIASWKNGHDKLAARSKHGESIKIANSSHFIHLDRPDVVLTAIGKVVDQARKRSTK